jgi:salicylate hydroxylase
MSPSLEIPLPSPSNHQSNGDVNVVKKSDRPVDEPTHPTRSLQFLKKLYPESHNHKSLPLQAKLKLRVIIVGGGLGGLACAIALARRGHTITVLEQATQLGEVGY